MKVLRRFKAADDRDIAVLEPIEPSSVPLEPLKVGGTAVIDDRVIIAGFPQVWSEAKPFPLMRGGIVASIRFKTPRTSVLVLDFASIPGFSGSPIVMAVSGLVVGVLSREPKMQGSGFSIAYVLTATDLAP